LNNWRNPKLWFFGRIPQGADGQLATSKRLARYMRTATFPACECPVLDLDNTLWDNELVEEVIEGIALGETYAGNIYKEFQRRLLPLQDRSAGSSFSAPLLYLRTPTGWGPTAACAAATTSCWPSVYYRGERLDRPPLANISYLEYNVKSDLERMKQALLERACGFPLSDVTYRAYLT